MSLEPLEKAFQWLHALDLDDVFGEPEPVTMRFTNDAADYFHKVRQEYFDRCETATGLYLSFLGKMPGKLVRLSGLLELLEQGFGEQGCAPKTISKQSVENAHKLIDSYFIPMAERVFGDLGRTKASRDATLLARKIHTDRPEVVNAKAIRDESWIPGLREAKDVDNALAILVDKYWLFETPTT